MELNANEVASLLGLPEQEVRERAHAGKLPHLDVQGRLRFNRQAILEWALRRDHPLNLGIGEMELAGLPSITELFVLPPEADKELIYDLFISREKLMTTAVGDGVAIPHLRVPVVVNMPRPALGVFFMRKPIDMAALDGKPVHTLFLLLSLSPRQHLDLLARMAFLFRKAEFVALLRNREKPETIIAWVLRTAPNGKNSKAV